MGQQWSVPDCCVIRLGSRFVPGVRQEILRFAQDDRRGLRMIFSPVILRALPEGSLQGPHLIWLGRADPGKSNDRERNNRDGQQWSVPGCCVIRLGSWFVPGVW